ncbi:MAG TPA: AbrB/MazE/SpoVT family DNA-binding domain-containing protein [Polyangia bacterium]|nr:AbrB/MazE/SpoVT family DNA-binding domain-containing protein [Polyangia bacterium]
MGKVTSKLQVTVPKAIAEQYRIRPGDEIAWVAAGESIRVLPAKPSAEPDVSARLRLFDEATRRQRRRDKNIKPSTGVRGWTREDLYDRGRPR